MADAAIDNIVIGVASPTPSVLQPVPTMPLSMLVLTALAALFAGRRKLRSAV